MNRYCHWLAAEPCDRIEEMDGPEWQEVLLADTEDLCYLSGIFVLANMSWSVLVMFSQQLLISKYSFISCYNNQGQETASETL